MRVYRSSCGRYIMIRSIISEGMFASVDLGLYRRLRKVPDDANDLMDMDDSEFRRLTLYDCFEYICDPSEANSGGISDRIGCLMMTALLFSVTFAMDVANFNLSRAGNLHSFLKDSAVRSDLVGFADKAEAAEDERKW
jgi:hypothetical protein